VLLELLPEFGARNPVSNIRGGGSLRAFAKQIEDQRIDSEIQKTE
jgi:hypothetical protein